MNEQNEIEARLQRDLSAVAGSTRATNRWDDVAARITDPDAARDDLDYVAVAAPRRSGSRPLAALVAFVAVLAGAFGVASLNGDGGADSPEAAVEDLFEAIAEEDPIGVLQAVAPSERDILVPVLERLAGELDRLDVSEDLDLRDLQGVEVEFADLQLATTPLSDDYAMVEVTNVRLRGDVQLADLPFAGALRGAVLPSADDPEPADSQVTDLKLVAVREDGGWHVGLQATLARFAQDESGVPAPDFAGGGFPEVGAESPEAAARQLIEATYRQDVRRMIELTPVSESAALHVWGPTLVGAVENGQVDDWPAVTVRALDFAVEDGDGGTKLVRPTAYRLTIDGEDGSGEVAFDGRCITERYTSADGELSDDHEDCGPFSGDPLTTTFETFYSVLGWGLPPMVTVVEQDGRWFVSAGWSYANAVLEDLEGFDPEDALRTVRSSYFGDGWADAPPQFWDACGVARPAADAASVDGEAAYERCYDRLPEDYEGPDDAVGRFFLFGYPGSYLEESDVDNGSAPTTTVIATTIPAPTTTGP